MPRKVGTAASQAQMLWLLVTSWFALLLRCQLFLFLLFDPSCVHAALLLSPELCPDALVVPLAVTPGPGLAQPCSKAADTPSGLAFPSGLMDMLEVVSCESIPSRHVFGKCTLESPGWHCLQHSGFPSFA